MISRTGSASTSMPTAIRMKDNGRMTSSMEKESRSGLMALCTQDTTKMAKNAARAILPGQTKVRIRAIFSIMIYTELASTHGLTDVSTRVSGSTARWKAREFLLGLMGACTWASISMIQNTVKVNSLGPMAAATMVHGSLASNMVKESICRMVESEKVSGRTANALIG